MIANVDPGKPTPWWWGEGHAPFVAVLHARAQLHRPATNRSRRRSKFCLRVESFDRREFLERAGRLGAAGGLVGTAPWLLSACGSSHDCGFGELAKHLQGTVVCRHDRGYSSARVLFNMRFDAIHPRAVVFCENVDDVERAIAVARKHDLRISVRSGGHSYGGYSTTQGIVLDVSRMNHVRVDAAGETAIVGAGTPLIDLYSQLWRQGFTVPAGSCPTVGIAGLALGGGVGFSGRKLGLTCDNVRELTVVTAARKAVTASEREHSDLYWACRGGGGGNFGVVTEFRFAVYPVDTVSHYSIKWPWANARKVVEAWQSWAPHAPDELFASCSLHSTGDKSAAARPIVGSVGQFFGSPADLRALLEPLIEAVEPRQVTVGQSTYMKAAMMWAGCAGTVADCHLPGSASGGTLERLNFKGKSAYVTKPLSRRAIDTLVGGIERRQADPALGNGSVLMDAYGGVINRVARDATAFVHRDALCSLQYLAFWDPRGGRTLARSNLRWINGFYEAMQPHVSGFAYQNYLDPDLADWQRAYYGSNLARLVSVKRAYDPADFFRFRQSIPTRV
jgi:FAD binding domain/Berberine and berberine like